MPPAKGPLADSIQRELQSADRRRPLAGRRAARVGAQPGDGARREPVVAPAGAGDAGAGRRRTPGDRPGRRHVRQPPEDRPRPLPHPQRARAAVGPGHHRRHPHPLHRYGSRCRCDQRGPRARPGTAGLRDRADPAGRRGPDLPRARLAAAGVVPRPAGLPARAGRSTACSTSTSRSSHRRRPSGSRSSARPRTTRRSWASSVATRCCRSPGSPGAPTARRSSTRTTCSGPIAPGSSSTPPSPGARPMPTWPASRSS